MGAEITYYAKVPRVTYEWVEVQAVTEFEVFSRYPTAVEVLDLVSWRERDDLPKGDLASGRGVES